MLATRRRLLEALGVAFVGVLARPRLGTAEAGLGDVLGLDPVTRFRSRPGLMPPDLTITRRAAGKAPTYLFLAPLTGPGQHGPMIVDEQGGLVWFHPLDGAVATSFAVQRYRGKPVLTWWQGEISNVGVGAGICVVVDQSYETVAQVRAGNGYQADLHEFLLTDKGTALLCAYDPVDADLSEVGGPAAGTVFDSIVQEVDVRTGHVLFEWHSLDHVPVADSYLQPAAGPFDYFHVNSIDVAPDGTLLVSARNTSALYSLDRTNGAVIWQLGGKRSDFELGPRAAFMWQHDARVHPDGSVTLFDDGPSPSSEMSRAIRLSVDRAGRRADLVQELLHPDPYKAVAMGSSQVLSDGAIVVGWGTVPGITEFAADGSVRFDADFTGGAWNYRARRFAWTGRPKTKPSLASVRSGSSTTVYASWNGATETAYWQVHAGNGRRALRHVRTVAAAGFETAVRVTGRPRFVAVTALDRKRSPLARSAVVAVRG